MIAAERLVLVEGTSSAGVSKGSLNSPTSTTVLIGSKKVKNSEDLLVIYE